MSNLINYWQHIDVFIYAEKEHKPSNPIPFYTFQRFQSTRELGAGVCVSVCERAALPNLLQMTEQNRKGRILKR